MTFQTSIAQADDFGPLGSLHGDFKQLRAAHNNVTEVAGVWNVAYTFDTGQSHTLTINGVPIATPGNTDDATTATDALADAQAVTFLSGVAIFAAGASGSITVTEYAPGSITSIVGAASGGSADTVVTVTTAAVNNDDLNPGLLVYRNRSNGGLFLPRAAASSPLYVAGITSLRHEGIDRRQSTEYVYPTGSQIPYLYSGGICVQTEEAVTETDNVYYRITPSGANTQRGAFRTDADTSTAVQLTNARWLRTTTAAGRALLYVDLI